GHGFNVVPSVTEEIPLDGTAINFIGEELSGAKLSIHLLGKSAGPAPADLEHIVKLQLTETAKRLSRSSQRDVDDFHRIIWAPKVFEDFNGQVIERDPIDALKSFGTQYPSDRIEGDSLSPFVEFALKHAKELSFYSAPKNASAGQIYLCHDEPD